jgi:SAM-dependent methyltransferase
MAAASGYRASVTGRPLYHSFAWAYDLVVTAPAGPGATAVAEALRARGLRPGATVLDAGCGGGRHAAELVGAGFAVTGLDRSPELLAVARERVPDARFEEGELRDWSPGAPFDAVLCRGVLNDLISDEDREAAAGGLRRALGPGGLLLADVRDWKASVEHYRAKPVHEAAAATFGGIFAFRSETTVDPERRLLRVRERIALDEHLEEYDFTMRCWTREELESTLRAAGFDAIEDAPGLGARSDRITVTARAA